MLELTRYDGRKRVRGSLVLAAGITALTALYVWMFPTLTESVDLNEYVDAWPPALQRAFGVAELGSIEGFLATELYAFVWVLLLGLYLAYDGASLVADEVERDRLDLLLALPISRRRLVLEKYAALLVPIGLLNAIVPVIVLLGVAAIGENLGLVDLLFVHVLSVPYLLATAGIGLACSVVLDRASIAQRVAMAVVFGLFLVDSVVTDTEVSWLGAISPSRYYDPTAILVRSDFDLFGGAILLVSALGLLAGSIVWFSRRDV